MAPPTFRSKKKQQFERSWVPRISFSNFALLLALLALLAFFPTLLFHFRLTMLSRGRGRKCGWLQSPPLVCAHGGDSIRAPPNTMAAYRLALDSKVDCIEVDASRTRDGVLVALHDRDLQDMYGSHSVRVGDLLMDEIHHLQKGLEYPKDFENQKVATIETILQYVSRSLKLVIIDAKVGPPLFEISLAADILSVVNKTQCRNCLVWAKTDGFVRELKMLSPEVMVFTYPLEPNCDALSTGVCFEAGYIVLKDPVTGKANDLFRIEEAEVVGVYYGLVNDRLVSDVHRAGKKVHVWTVNDKEEMERMLYEGVDCIVTSYPHLLQKLMLELKQQCQEEGFLN